MQTLDAGPTTKKTKVEYRQQDVHSLLVDLFQMDALPGHEGYIISQEHAEFAHDLLTLP